MKTLKKLSFEILGAALFAVGIGYFINSCDIAPGGVSGVSLILNYLYNLPIGTMSFILNIPILLWGYFSLDKRMILRSLRIIFVTSVFLDLVTTLFPVFTGERLLGGIFGGVISGIGIGLVFYVGGTTGGTDVLSYILQKKFPFLQIGTAILVIDCIIISISMIVYNDMESGMYGIISLYCTTKAIDMVVYGADSASVIMIVSDKAPDISQYITIKMERGITIWDCKGGYSDKSHSILMCAVRKRQISKLKTAVRTIDSRAFMICMRSSDIYGEGFE